MRMVGAIVAALALLGAAACRQADGAVPVPDADRLGDIQDLGKGMLYVQGGATGSAQELEDDFMRLAEALPDTAPAARLIQRLIEALQSGAALEAQDAERLGERL